MVHLVALKIIAKKRELYIVTECLHIATIILLCSAMIIFGKLLYIGSQSTSRKIMVDNPIYDHRGPVYDTILTIPSETLADSEVSEIPTVSGFQNSSSTSTNAYVDEPHNSSLQRNPLGNVHTPSVSLNLKDDAANGCTTVPSLEEGCGGQVVTEPEKGEETYTLMIPAVCGTVTNKKS